MRIRLLPLTIFAAVLLLGLKVGDIWNGAWRTTGTGIAEVQAQDAEEDTAEAEDGEDEVVAEGEAAEEELTEEELNALALKAEEAEPLLQAAPELTQAELDVLQRLRLRREELDSRAVELEMRESVIAAAEHNLEGRIEEWRRLQSKVEALLARYENEQAEELERLATYYEKMKPKDAARVFNALEMTYLIDIVSRMNDARVAEIIGKMETIKAMELTMEMAKRRNPAVLAQETAVQ